MNAYTHRRALAAAARLALATCALDACAKAQAEPTPPAPQPDAPPRHDASDAVVAAREPEAAPAAERRPVDPIRNCHGIVDEAFPKESEYPGETRNVGTKVQACCAELLVHEGADIGRHRWDCCANLPEGKDDGDQEFAMACTPWGPPVPPAMPRTEVA